MLNENLQKEIEAYINHDLSKAERHAFEQKMTQDPLLRTEVELQSAIISTIQTNGRLALKQTLEVTNVSLLSTAVNEAIKYGVAALATGAFVVGTYFALQSLPTDISTEAPVEQAVPTVTLQEEKPAEPAKVSSNASSTRNLNVSANAEAKQSANRKSKVKSQKVQTPVVGVTVIEKPESAVSVNVEDQTIDADMALPAAAGVNKIPGGSIGFNEKTFGPKSSPKVEILAGDKLTHKYTYHNSKLILIGDFADKIYELIELKVDGGKMLFIYYNTKFYPIEDGTVEPVTMKEIEDQILLQELVNLRKKNVE
jgi:hypothetical protein